LGGGNVSGKYMLRDVRDEILSGDAEEQTSEIAYSESEGYAKLIVNGYKQSADQPVVINVRPLLEGKLKDARGLEARQSNNV